MTTTYYIIRKRVRLLSTNSTKIDQKCLSESLKCRWSNLLTSNFTSFQLDGLVFPMEYKKSCWSFLPHLIRLVLDIDFSTTGSGNEPFLDHALKFLLLKEAEEYILILFNLFSITVFPATLSLYNFFFNI